MSVEKRRGALLIRVFVIQVDAYPRYAASALASNALVRCTFAGESPYRRQHLGRQVVVC